MSVAFIASVLAIALLQGALVALPRRDALVGLTSFRSPVWALVLPGLIIVGTFGLVLVPSGAMDLLTAATFATPPLAGLAAIAVVRKHLASGAFLLIAAAGMCAVLCHGVIGQVGASLVTACGAMLVGTAIVRLLPGRWLLAAVAVMCLADLVLMNTGVGRLSSHVMDSATLHFHGPSFDTADIGTIITEYPDMLLAAVIGAFVAGRPDQRRTALLVVACVGSYDLLLLLSASIPATPPLCIALGLGELRRWSSQPGRRLALGGQLRAQLAPLAPLARPLNPLRLISWDSAPARGAA